jgi:hypothetical protein
MPGESNTLIQAVAVVASFADHATLGCVRQEVSANGSLSPWRVVVRSDR